MTKFTALQTLTIPYYCIYICRVLFLVLFQFDKSFHSLINKSSLGKGIQKLLNPPVVFPPLTVGFWE